MRGAPQLDRPRRGRLLLLVCLLASIPLFAAERAQFEYRFDPDVRLGISDVIDSNGWLDDIKVFLVVNDQVVTRHRIGNPS